LASYEVIVNLIANATTKRRLETQATLDTPDYPNGIEISDAQMKELNLKKHDFHGYDLNYTIILRTAQNR
jgi:hypothetical protein